MGGRLPVHDRLPVLRRGSTTHAKQRISASVLAKSHNPRHFLEVEVYHPDGAGSVEARTMPVPSTSAAQRTGRML